MVYNASESNCSCFRSFVVAATTLALLIVYQQQQSISVVNAYTFITVQQRRQIIRSLDNRPKSVSNREINSRLSAPVLFSSSSSSSSPSESSTSPSVETAATTPSPSSSPSPPRSFFLHHTAIKTRNIENAIKFYSLFGYEIEHKFRSGPARAAWLTNSVIISKTNGNKDSDNANDDDNENEEKQTIKGQNDVASRIELIEVPAYMLNEKENTVKKAIDLIKNESLLGLNHYALDVTPYIKYIKQVRKQEKNNDDGDDDDDEYYGLDQLIDDIELQSLQKFNKTLRVAVQPRQQVIGNQVYELAFLYDADGTIIELVRYIKEVDLKDGQEMYSGWEPWDGTGFVGKE